MKARIKFRKKGQKAAKAKAKPAPKPESDLTGVDLDAYGNRWAKGEGIAALAKEINKVSWNKLHSELTKRGYRKGVAP